jgi:hypothetical protein
MLLSMCCVVDLGETFVSSASFVPYERSESGANEREDEDCDIDKCDWERLESVSRKSSCL